MRSFLLRKLLQNRRFVKYTCHICICKLSSVMVQEKLHENGMISKNALLTFIWILGTLRLWLNKDALVRKSRVAYENHFKNKVQMKVCNFERSSFWALTFSALHRFWVNNAGKFFTFSIQSSGTEIEHTFGEVSIISQ